MRKIQEFDAEYEEKLIEFTYFIISRLNIQDKRTIARLIQKAEKIFRDIRKNGLTRKIVHNQNLRYPEKFAIILTYYSLKLNDINHINGEFLKPATIYNKIKEILYERNLERRNIKRPQLLSGFILDYLSTKDQNKLINLTEFKAKIKAKIPYKQNVVKKIDDMLNLFEDQKNLQIKSIKIIDDLFTNNFKRINIPTQYRNPENLARVIIFLALHFKRHLKQPEIEKVKDFLTIFSNISDLHTRGFYEILPIVYSFLSISILKEIKYLPQNLSIVDKSILEDNLWRNFSQIVSLLSYSNTRLLRNIAGDLYDNMIKNNFDYNEFPSYKIEHLSSALLFLSLQYSTEHSKISRRKFINQLSNRGYHLDEHNLKPILIHIRNHLRNYDLKYNFHKEITTDFFKNELEKISLNHQVFNRKTPSTFTTLILSLFNSANMNPRDFAEKIRIYSQDPSHLLTRIENSNVLTRVDVFEEMVININNFIEKYIPVERRKQHKSLLKKVENYFSETKKYNKYKSYLKVKKRQEKYGENYASTLVRLERMITMLGFSVYDGYDFIENIYRTPHNKLRINAQLHHSDYNSKNDKKENLNFLPSKHPNDSGEKINYMTHSYISGLEANLIDERSSEKTKLSAKNELEKIKNRIFQNQSIIKQCFQTKDEKFLEQLVGWTNNSIKAIGHRVKDIDLNWASGLNKIIPKDKYGKKISNQDFKDLLEILNLSKILTYKITFEDLKEFKKDHPKIPAFKNGYPTKEFIMWLIKKGKIKENVDITLPISTQPVDQSIRK